MSDTRKRTSMGPTAEQFLASGKGRGNRKRQPKEGRSFRTLIDWQRVDLSRRDTNLTPNRSRMSSTRYVQRHNSPMYRELQVACSIVEPLR